ncbi:hypothetical protein GCM10007916_15440 [Psychromonas marina]|uniref:diguanylate cyclase n=1 Tax=Psychromonas marina TaxID=88364 RepID=A0ABQ6DZH7_9GAMM|nr:diguanylate cyclase [Psychromonas marina]GLS90477.1 hypothetical protein GCM10007916_15440 [Psychromonas marina]
MSKYIQTEDKADSDAFTFDLDGEEGKAVVDIAEYRHSEQAESSGFEKVMSQMNIADRSAFDKKYEQLWLDASMDGSSLSVLLCEIDAFKSYIDNYGQQGASFMLLVVGLALKNICDKHGCFLAHYQKEEFGILLKGKDEEAALNIAEALRSAVEASQTEHKFSNISRVVTLSIGVSSIYPNSMSMLIEKANNTLHQARLSGRNQVSVDLPPQHESASSEVSNFKQFLLDMQITDQASLKVNFSALWQECQAEEELLSMIICGFDFLNPYIEHYGKQSSEDALLIVACALQQTCEKHGGFVYYLDDGNFIVLLKGGNATRALKIAEQMHQFIAESATEHKASEVSDAVTVSIGLSSIFPSELTTMALLRDEAKKAFHGAIKAGRNQTNVSF